jgi:hypothetical protein
MSITESLIFFSKLRKPKVKSVTIPRKWEKIGFLERNARAVERFRQTMRDAHRDIQNTNIFQLRNNEFQ